MITIVLPAYNEAACIGALLESFAAVLATGSEECRFIVVNDGSTDDTEQVVRGFQHRLPLELINHPANRGLAGAIATGLQQAVASCSAEDVIVTLDADNSHPPELLFPMVRLIREGAAVVVASRYQPGAEIHGLSLFRQVLSFGAALLFRLVFPLPGVRDYTCGYRAYRAGLLQRAMGDYGDAFISETGFSCMVDILLKLRRYEPVMVEVPLILRYDQKKSVSKMKVGRTVRQTLLLLLRRRLGR